MIFQTDKIMVTWKAEHEDPPSLSNSFTADQCFLEIPCKHFLNPPSPKTDSSL